MLAVFDVFLRVWRILQGRLKLLPKNLHVLICGRGVGVYERCRGNWLCIFHTRIVLAANFEIENIENHCMIEIKSNNYSRLPVNRSPIIQMFQYNSNLIFLDNSKIFFLF